MRIFCTILLLLLALAGIAGAADVASPALDYRLELRLFPDEHRLEASATLGFTDVPAPAELRLATQAEVLSVTTAGRTLPFTFRDGQLHIHDGQRAKGAQLTIRYRAAFNDQPPSDTVGIEDPSFGVNAFIGAQGTFLAEGIPWFPHVEGVRGRHLVSVTAPHGMSAVTAGRFLGSRTENGLTISEWESNFPSEGLALAAGTYEIARGDLDGIQLLTFLSPPNASLAPAYLSAMQRHLAFYRDLLGPYPYAKFAVVENFLPTGFGLPSWTLLGSSVVRLPFLLDTSLPHEIVHSWWGNAVEIDFAQGNWAEGLTSYLADYLLKERANPPEALEYRRKLLRDYAALVTPALDFPLTKFTGRSAKYQQAIGYGKGAMVFHMLRGLIGDDAFRSGLRQMAREGHQARLSWRDLEVIFSRAAGQNLRWFFQQWVERAGAPVLQFADVSAVQHAKGWRLSGKVAQNAPVYRLDLPLRVTDEAGHATEQVLRLAGPVSLFTIDSPTQPRRLEGDPDSNLFRQLAPEELPATINDLTSPRRPLVIVAAGQEELRAASRDLLKGLHWDYAEIVEEDRVDPEVLSGRDQLFLGWPRRPELRPKLPFPLKITTAADRPEWELTGERRSGDALFAVIAGRHQQETTRALLLAQSPQAARAVAAKIAHYGRYSLLLFEGGRNLAKITWEPDASPLTVVFPQEPRP